MYVQKVVSGEFTSNSYIIHEDKRCFVVDTNTSAQEILRHLDSYNLPRPEFVVITHGHFDHFGGAKTISEKFNIPIYMNLSDEKITKSANFSMMLLRLSERVHRPEFFSIEKSEAKLSEFGFKCIHAPGHTPGSTVIVGNEMAFVGDLFTKKGLFLNHLPGENRDELQSSFLKIRKILRPTTMIFPGHGANFEFRSIESETF